MTRALHRLLRRVLPRDFRARHGAAMEEVFLAARDAAARRGASALVALWLREASDLVATGRRLRAEERRYGIGYVARGLTRRRTEERGGWTMGVVDDLRYAFRSLVRRPSLTFFAAVTLALGIGATTAIFSTLESVILNPLPYEHGDRLVGIFRQMGEADFYVTPSVDDAMAWAEQTDAFEALEPWTFRTLTLTGRGDAREVTAALVSPSFFEMLGRSPTLGRLFDEGETAGEGADVVVVGHAFWRSQLGASPDAVGGPLTLDGRTRTVIGVLPPRTHVPGMGLRTADVWLPLADAMDGPKPVTALLREGVSVDVANERLRQLATTDETAPRSVGRALLVSEQVGGGLRPHLSLLMGAVVLLLLISCANVSNLLLFRADARKRETAVRSALGGARFRLARQSIVESLVLALLGGGLGVALSYVGQALILELRPSELDILDQVSINGRVLAFAVSVSVATGLLFGWLPAWTASRSSALAGLRTGARSEGDVIGGRLRWALVAGEVALSFALLLASLSVVSTLVERRRTDLGFRAGELAVMELFAPTWKYGSAEESEPVFDAIEQRVARLPGVVHASRASGVPPEAGVWFGNLQVEGEESTPESVLLFGPHVRPGYFETVGQRVVRGRSFVEEDLGTEDRIMIGEGTAEAFFGGRDPVGQRFRMSEGDEWMTVIGVAADVPMSGLREAEAPYQFYLPLRGGWRGSTILARVATGDDPARLLGLMRDLALDVEPDMRVDELTVAADKMRGTLERERFATTLMATFAALALVLAAVGLYGVVSQLVGQRTREIGIRIALGARTGSIAGIVLRRTGGATFLGVSVGIALALGGTRVLASRVFGLAGNGAGTYALAALALGLTSLVAAYGPTRRATRVDPVEAMRVE